MHVPRAAAIFADSCSRTPEARRAPIRLLSRGHEPKLRTLADATHPPGKKLNLFDATMLVMGGIIGVGIFFNPRAIAELVPEPTAFLGLWVIGGLIAMLGALTFAELGSTYPSAGGWYVFLREAFGPFPAFLFGSVVLAVVSTGATAVMLSICTANLHGIVPGIGAPGSTSATVAGALILVAITALTMMGAKVGARLQNACMIVKLAAIGALIVGAWFVFTPHGAPPDPAIALGRGGIAGGMIQAALPVFFAFGGWQMVCYIAPQVREPQKNVPRAILLGVAGVVVVYVAINAAYLHVLGIGGIAGNREFASQMARETLGATGGEILRAAIGVSALGVCAVTVIATPWLFVAMSREGLFFKRFGELHPRTGAPVNALFAQMLLALGYWLWGQAEVLVDSVVFVEWIFHALVAIALLRLRATQPDLPRPFRTPFYPAVPVLYLLVAIAIVFGTLFQAFHTNGRAIVIGLSVIAVAAIVYGPWKRLVARA